MNPTAMTYELRRDEAIGNGIQRIVCQEIEGAIHSSGAHPNGHGSPVHETRKHLKKARAALRFAAREVDSKAWKREDRRLRKVALLISEVRDAEVRLQTVRDLRKFAQGKKRSFSETEELLAFELDSFLAAFADWPEEARQRLTHILGRIQDWPLASVTSSQLRKCVQKTYQRSRKALKVATKSTDIRDLHTFRKRAKELWYQLRILRPLAPAVFGDLIEDLRVIGQHLGQLHDLAFVEDRLASIGTNSKRGERILNMLIESRENELAQIAIALGEHFFAERPRQFGKEIAQYFSEWESEPVDSPPAKNRLSDFV